MLRGMVVEWETSFSKDVSSLRVSMWTLLTPNDFLLVIDAMWWWMGVILITWRALVLIECLLLICDLVSLQRSVWLLSPCVVDDKNRYSGILSLHAWPQTYGVPAREVKREPVLSSLIKGVEINIVEWRMIRLCLVSIVTLSRHHSVVLMKETMSLTPVSISDAANTDSADRNQGYVLSPVKLAQCIVWARHHA